MEGDQRTLELYDKDLSEILDRLFEHARNLRNQEITWILRSLNEPGLALPMCEEDSHVKLHVLETYRLLTVLFLRDDDLSDGIVEIIENFKVACFLELNPGVEDELDPLVRMDILKRWDDSLLVEREGIRSIRKMQEDAFSFLKEIDQS